MSLSLDLKSRNNQAMTKWPTHQLPHQINTVTVHCPSWSAGRFWPRKDTQMFPTYKHAAAEFCTFAALFVMYSSSSWRPPSLMPAGQLTSVTECLFSISTVGKTSAGDTCSKYTHEMILSSVTMNGTYAVQLWSKQHENARFIIL